VQTLAVINQKGGSGKTTTAVNLAAALGELGERVLVVDLDPQASASAWFNRARPSEEKGLIEVFTGNVHLSDLVAETDVAGVSLVPASGWLVGIEKTLAGEVGSETIFRRALARLRGSGRAAAYSYVLVDCPPALGFLSVAALAACHQVFVPVEAHVMALSGLAALTHTVETVRERLNPELTLSGILACRVDSRTTLAREVVARLRERFGALVFKTVIRENVRLAEAPSFHQPITVYAPNSPGAADYRATARELVRRATKGTRP
jgi:chromosome partitioning protein